MVAVVTDGSAVLGLGDIGPEAALPVMEGKAMLFKEFGGVDAFPICLATQDVDEIVATVRALAPGFGGINLEDIAAPRCFEIEERLRDELDIPVFHDDQHGTAIVVLAALIERAARRRQATRGVQDRDDRVRSGRDGRDEDLLCRRARATWSAATSGGALYRGPRRAQPGEAGVRRRRRTPTDERAPPTRCSRAPTSSSASRSRAP